MVTHYKRGVVCKPRAPLLEYLCQPTKEGSRQERGQGGTARLLLDRRRGRDVLDDLRTDQLVEAADVLQLVGLHHLVEEGDGHLGAHELGEGRDVLDLLLGPRALAAGDQDLLHQRVLLVSRELADLGLRLLPAVEDILSREDGLVVLHVVAEGDRRLDAHEAQGDGVQEIGSRAGALLEDDAGVLQRLVEAVPAALAGVDLAGLDRALVPEVTRVLPDEVHEHGVDTRLLRPVEPVLDRGLEVDRPEPVQEGRVHLVDGVFRGGIHRGEDARLGVELPAVQLVVEHDLESTLHDLGRGPIELIEEDDLRGLAGRHVPVRRSEARDALGELGEAEEVALGHLREAPVDEVLLREPQDRGDLPEELRLADAVGAADEDRDVRRQGGGGLDERLDVQR